MKLYRYRGSTDMQGRRLEFEGGVGGVNVLEVRGGGVNTGKTLKFGKGGA